MSNILDLGKGKGKNKNNNKGQSQSKKGKSVSIKQSKSIECDNCTHDIYVQSVHVRKIPKIIAGTPKDVIIPVDVFLCANCGELQKELLADEMQQFFK